MPNLVDEVNATTQKVIRPRKIADLAFKRKSPFLTKMREDALPHSGGAFLENAFLYGKTVGGPYAKGTPFDLARTQLLDVTRFTMKFYEQNDTQFLEEIDVENNGDAKVFSIIDAHQEAMFLTMNENLSIEAYRHGQASSSTVSDNRIVSINGLAEALNDGVTNSWDGNVFPVYGGNTRNGTIGDALNSVPYFFGNSDGSAGPITYAGALEQFLEAKGGDWTPNLAVGNKPVYGYILQRIQPQQRYGNEKSVRWGVESFNLMGMEFLCDEYCPSARNGKNDPRTGNFLTSTFTSAASPATASNLPGSTTITVGECLFFFNTFTYQMHLSNAKRFQFGWTGYKEAQNSTIVAGQLLVALNILCQFPWANRQMYGING